MLKKMVFVLLAIGLMTSIGSPVLAHRMLIETPERGVILVRYDDNTVAQRAVVTLYDEDGNILQEGTVNEQGLFRFHQGLRPYRIIANDGMGHRARWTAGEGDTGGHFPQWQRAFFGVALLLSIAAVTYYRKGKNSAH